MITVGIDEVGRGCWAGPLVAGAVALPADFVLNDSSIKLRDSKKLSKKQRELAAVFINKRAVAIGLGWVWPLEIDTIGITASVKLAMTRAIETIMSEYDEIIVDGNINYFADNPKARALIKADDIIPAVSAASIVAKVARDAYMVTAAEQYDKYGFEQHVGYGTKLHMLALARYGICELHRKSYKPIQKIMASYPA